MQNLPDQKAILEHVLERIRSFRTPTQDIVCIFDLDSTLYDLTDRKQQIVLSYLKIAEKLSKFPNECDRLKHIQVHKNEFGIDEALSRVGLTQAQQPAFYEDVYKYWEFYFFHNDFLRYDVTIDGAVEYVRKVDALGAQVIYLTGRDEPRMGEGTLASLKASGFPLEKNSIQICMKPHSKVEDHDFKLDFMNSLEENFKEVWLFENEPVNINLIEKHFPATRFVFIDTNHCGRETISPRHFSIKDFK